MIEIGQYNTLRVARDTSVGLFLEDEEENDVLLHGKFIPEGGLKEGDEVEVFIYKDNEGRDIATTQQPKLTAEEFALLEVTSVTKFGAFVDIGLDKELLVPFMEQARKMEVGEFHLVFMYLDGLTDRLAGSTKLEQFLDNEELDLKENEAVDIIFWKPTDLGYKVIVNEEHIGLVYSDQLYEYIPIGTRRQAFVHKIRTDNKIDIRLQKFGYAKVEPNAQKILTLLKEQNGFLELTDKSSPEKIKKILGMSKKTFKKAIGSLYKQKRISLEPTGIQLTDAE
jgi:predicted RNA-binding protein (virulence factor B family)